MAAAGRRGGGRVLCPLAGARPGGAAGSPAHQGRGAEAPGRGRYAPPGGQPAGERTADQGARPHGAPRAPQARGRRSSKATWPRPQPRSSGWSTRSTSAASGRRRRAPGEAADLQIGAVVREGDTLGAILPPSALKVVAHFPPPAALGRLQPGQPARLRLTGFPWTQYGSVAATVASVAHEARDGQHSCRAQSHAGPRLPPSRSSMACQGRSRSRWNGSPR